MIDLKAKLANRQMTRNEWRQYYAETRLTQTTGIVSTRTLRDVLREFYDYAYTPQQEAFIRLTKIYQDELKDPEKNQIFAYELEAKARAAAWWRDLAYRNNPFLALIRKREEDGSFLGRYIPVVIKYEP